MIFQSTINQVYRIRYRREISHPMFRVIDEKLNFNLIANNEIISSRINISDADQEDVRLIITRSSRQVNLYLISYQSLEVSDFKTVFKKPTDYRKIEKVKLTNTGEDLLTIYSVSTDDEHFELNKFDEPIVLPPGEGFILDLSFKPIRFGFHNAKLVIKTSIADHEIIEFDLFGLRKQGKSYYRYIDGVRYDRLLLEIAYSVIMQNEDRVIDYDQIRIIIRNVWDAGYITATEKRSLRYIWDNYDWSENARKWFRVGYGYILNE